MKPFVHVEMGTQKVTLMMRVKLLRANMCELVPLELHLLNFIFIIVFLFGKKLLAILCI